MVSWHSQKPRKKILVRVGVSLISKKPRRRNVIFPRKREREILHRVMVSWLSMKPRKRNFSQGYGVMAFQEATRGKCYSGVWCRCFPNSHDREMLVRVMVSWLSKEPRKRNFSQGNGVVAFPEDAKEKFGLGLKCGGFPRSHERVMLIRVMVSQLSQIPRMRNNS